MLKFLTDQQDNETGPVLNPASTASPAATGEPSASASASAAAAATALSAPAVTSSPSTLTGSNQVTEQTQRSKALHCLNLLCESALLAPCLLQLMKAK